jgi:hypothetical protein
MIGADTALWLLGAGVLLALLALLAGVRGLYTPNVRPLFFRGQKQSGCDLDDAGSDGESPANEDGDDTMGDGDAEQESPERRYAPPPPRGVKWRRPELPPFSWQ